MTTDQIVFIYVTTTQKTKDLDPDDKSIPGLYEVALDQNTPQAGLANAALDGFHVSFGISRLDDFDIVVRKSEYLDSDVIEQSDQFTNQELEGHVKGVSFVCSLPRAKQQERMRCQ